MKRTLALLLLLAIAGAFATFCIANRDLATLSFYPLPYSVDLPVFLLVLLSLMLGAAAAGLASVFSSLGGRWELMRSRRRIKALENEIGGIRAEKTTALQAHIHE